MFYLIPYFELKLISLGKYSIESWRILQFGGKLAALYIFFIEAKRLRLNIKTVVAISLLAAPLTTFFEKLLFYLSHEYFHLNGYLYHFTIAGWPALGRVYFGGLIGLFLAVILGVFITRQSKQILKYLDIVFLSLIAGTFFYRVGNLFWHSHIGKITNVPWGMELQGQIRHEISLYEMISLALLFSVVWLLRKKITQSGLLFFVILSGMSLSRFILDFLRSDDLPTSNFHFQNGLTLNQITYGILFLLCFGFILFLLKKRGENSPDSNPQ
jgi:phosphatidylglycerol:prolipoprotein diacylglycerol transferase